MSRSSRRPGAGVEPQRGPHVVDARAEDVDERQHALQQRGPVHARRGRGRVDDGEVERRGEPRPPGRARAAPRAAAAVRRSAPAAATGSPRAAAAAPGRSTAEPSNSALAPTWCQNERSRPSGSNTSEYEVERPSRSRIWSVRVPRARSSSTSSAPSSSSPASPTTSTSAPERREVAARVGHAAAGADGERPDLQQLARPRGGGRRDLRDEVDADMTGDHDRAHRGGTLRRSASGSPSARRRDAMGAGRTYRMGRIFGADGRTLILPVDHGLTLGRSRASRIPSRAWTGCSTSPATGC